MKIYSRLCEKWDSVYKIEILEGIQSTNMFDEKYSGELCKWSENMFRYVDGSNCLRNVAS